MQQFESDSFLESDEARTQRWVQIVAKSARAYSGVLDKRTGLNKHTGPGKARAQNWGQTVANPHGRKRFVNAISSQVMIVIWLWFLGSD
jgi:hypothetical protein